MSSGPKPASRPTWATTSRARRTYSGLLGSVSETGSENPSPSPSFISAVSRSIRPLHRPAPPRGDPSGGSPEVPLCNFGGHLTQMYTTLTRASITRLARGPEKGTGACLGALLAARDLVRGFLPRDLP